MIKNTIKNGCRFCSNFNMSWSEKVNCNNGNHGRMYKCTLTNISLIKNKEISWENVYRIPDYIYDSKPYWCPLNKEQIIEEYIEWWSSLDHK